MMRQAIRNRFPARRLVLTLALMLAATSCINDPLGPGESRALRRAEARWESKNIHDYTFEMRTSCFCPPEMYEWAVVEVRADRVVSARTLDGVELTGYGLTSRKTVDELFDTIKDPEDWVSDIDVGFDEELGYPRIIVFESKPNIADAGAVYEARNLEPFGSR